MFQPSKTGCVVLQTCAVKLGIYYISFNSIPFNFKIAFVDTLLCVLRWRLRPPKIRLTFFLRIIRTYKYAIRMKKRFLNLTRNLIANKADARLLSFSRQEFLRVRLYNGCRVAPVNFSNGCIENILDYTAAFIQYNLI